MASLYDILLGQNSPVAKWGNSNSNTLLGLGTALLSGPRLDLSPVQQGRMADIAVADKQAEEAKQAQQANATRQLFERDAPDLAQLLDTGVPMGEVWGEYMRRKQPQTTEPKNPFMSAGDGKFFNWQTGEWVTDPNATPKPKDAPTGYEYKPDGSLGFIPGGPADPSTPGKTTEAQRRNQQLASVIEPELDKVITNWAELAKGENQAAGSNPVTMGMTSGGYQQAMNSLATIAQSYLYSVSGAAATDAEVRKIVDSVTPKPFENPASVSDKLDRIKKMVQAVVDAGGAGGPNPSAGNDVESILSGLGI